MNGWRKRKAGLSPATVGKHVFRVAAAFRKSAANSRPFHGVREEIYGALTRRGCSRLRCLFVLCLVCLPASLPGQKSSRPKTQSIAEFFSAPSIRLFQFELSDSALHQLRREP